MPFHLIGDSLQHDKHGIVFGQDAPYGETCVSIERLQFAEKKEPEDVIDVGIEKDNSRDGRMASLVVRGMRMEVGSEFDLRAEIRRSTENKPMF